MVVMIRTIFCPRSSIHGTVRDRAGAERTCSEVMGMPSVLVVDDDPDVCDLVTYKLEQSGYDVRRACDGDTAMREVEAGIPDVVLLDVMMPGVSGLQVLEQWRADAATASMPVIILTAKAQEGDVERGFELGADDYVVKPFSPRELARRVTAVISRSERR